ncbi:MAG: SPOR domain-containing protein [Methanobrevibacter sp.]|nr:SPOR domain-containing protein [Methanobrevibacter sp.]
MTREEAILHAEEVAEKNERETPSTDGKSIYRVQVGAYSRKENAENMVKKLKESGFDAVLIKS